MLSVYSLFTTISELFLSEFNFKPQNSATLHQALICRGRVR